jgi:cobalt-zinc-cadmium efflux system outer membrane protein
MMQHLQLGGTVQRVIIVVWLCISGCAARVTAPRLADISTTISARSGYPTRNAAAFEIPAGVRLEDGVSEDEAIALALWNHAGFQADLATLGFSRADVLDARMMRNPIFSLLFPVGPKQLEATLNWPIEALWQRPHRLAAARLDVERVAQGLVEHGLDLVRDARFAHANALIAAERLALAQETQALRNTV